MPNRSGRRWRRLRRQEPSACWRGNSDRHVALGCGGAAARSNDESEHDDGLTTRLGETFEDGRGNQGLTTGLKHHLVGEDKCQLEKESNTIIISLEACKRRGHRETGLQAETGLFRCSTAKFPNYERG